MIVDKNYAKMIGVGRRLDKSCKMASVPIIRAVQEMVAINQDGLLNMGKY